jgi:integrase
MATLHMARLWRDPRTGIWKLRRRIPQRYRGVANQKGATVKISTGTADRKAAEKALPEVLRQWGAMEAAWERTLNGGAPAPSSGRSLTNREAHALAGLWYRRLLHEFEADPAAVDRWDGWDTNMPTDPYDEDEDPGAIANGSARVRPEYLRQKAVFLVPFMAYADDLLASVHVTTDATSKERLAGLLVQRLPQALARFGKRLSGDYRPDPLREMLPDWESRTVSEPVAARPTSVSLRDLFAAWKRVAALKPRVIEETRYVVDALISFVGHDDAAEVSREDLIRWRTAMTAEGRTNDTWNNRLSMIRQVLARGVSDGKLKTNLTDGLRLSKGRPASWLPYSDVDAARILNAARRETGPSLRWAHWVMAFTGMRVGEVMQLTGGDIRRDGDIWFIAVNEDDPGKSVKNSQRRSVPIHPALIAEGFVHYAETIAADAPLFPDKQADKFGQRGGRAWNVVGKWVRSVVKITDSRKAPSHSWRHRMEDELRNVEAGEDVRDAIMGHARKTTGRVYGVRGEALGRLYRFLSKVPVPGGIEIIRAAAE